MLKQCFVHILIFSLLNLLFQSVFAQNGLEVKFQPSDNLYVYETKGIGTPIDIFTGVIQNIAIVNNGSESVDIQNVEILAYRDNLEIQKILVPNEILAQSAKKFKAYQDQGILNFYDFQFQTSRYLKGLSFSDNTVLDNNEVIVITHQTLLFQTLPDLIKVAVDGINTSGEEVKGLGELKVVNYHSENQYYFPLKGIWYAGGAPSLISHHRWGSIQEFAYDFVQLGENGKTHSGDGSKLTDYYAYGEPIFAVGDGIVEAVKDGEIESDSNLRQPHESDEDYSLRTAQQQQALLAKGFSNILGNYIILKHDNGEYSFYVHLKNGSVKVKNGEQVKRGQEIAALGHSGNSTEPHLHFHVTDSPDLAYSRSLPVTFNNISLYPDGNGTVRHIHYGQIIISNN